MIRSLSYLGFTSPAADAWVAFGPEILGLQLGGVGGVGEDGEDGTVRLRMDDAVHRLLIHPGEIDDLAYIGWDTGGPAALAQLCTRLTETHGIDVRHQPELAAERQVADLAWFTDPFGFRHELTWGLTEWPGSFVPGRTLSRFVTGDGGLGHIVLLVPDPAEADRFYMDVMGFQLTDRIEVAGGIRFLHCNARHHTLAYAPARKRTGFHHLMLEVGSVDDVGRALDLVTRRSDIPVTMSLGRHTNDHMLSFYLRTPSGFDIEYGTGGRTVPTGAPWPCGRYDAMSIWGHHAIEPPLRPGILRTPPALEGAS